MIAFDENISVLLANIQSRIKPSQCQVRRTREITFHPNTPRCFSTSGRRSIASFLSSSLSHHAVVEVGVSGNARNPKMATGMVMQKSRMNNHRQPGRPRTPSEEN